MEKERIQAFEIFMLFIMMLMVIWSRIKWPYLLMDGDFSVLWINLGVGSMIGLAIRRKKRYAVAILPFLLLFNYFSYKVNINIPAYTIILTFLCGLILYHSWKYGVSYKRFSSTLAIILLAAFFVGNASAYNRRILKDINLDYIVKQELGIGGKISKADLKNVERILISSRYKVYTLEGIEGLEGLKSLGIWDNTDLIKDLGRISSLKELERLVLWDLKLEQLQELQEMTSIKKFELIYPHKGQLPQLVFFPNLEVLEMQGLDLDSLDALKSLKSLEYLSIADGKVVSFDGIEGLDSLKTLSMYKLEVSDSDIMKIFELKNLQTISLNNMEIPAREEFNKKAEELGIVIEAYNSMIIDDI